MNKQQIIQAKKDIQTALLKDQLIIFFTRIIEDIGNKRDDFYGRIKELFLVLDPYKNNTRNLLYEKSITNNFQSEFGLQINFEEKEMLSRLFKGLQRDFDFKDYNTTKGIAIKSLKTLNEKYLPNSSEVIEPFILGKLISFFGGINNLYKKPSSTIQLIGAEKALFRHKANLRDPPKYGLIYRSKYLNGKNKGKLARQLANKLSIKLKVDYFQNFAQ